jgi:PadR family transcriptional regulator PadR
VGSGTPGEAEGGVSIYVAIFCLGVGLTFLVIDTIRRLHARFHRRADEAVGKLAATMLADPDVKHFAYTLSRKSGVGSGVVYPALSRMLEHGWLECGWETPSEAVGRPPRRWYRVTPAGREAFATGDLRGLR